jgi:hypothetical protein
MPFDWTAPGLRHRAPGRSSLACESGRFRIPPGGSVSRCREAQRVTTGGWITYKMRSGGARGEDGVMGP